MKGRKQIPDHVTEIILESISDGVFTVDHEWHVTSFNRAAEKITGVTREKAVGKYCWEIFRSNMCEKDCALRRTMKQGKSFIDTSTHILTEKGLPVPVVVSTSLPKDMGGRILGGVETFRDMSLVEELRKKLEDRFQVGDIISRNPDMHKIFRILPQVAESDSTVLIQGETGTGKELLASATQFTSTTRLETTSPPGMRPSERSESCPPPSSLLIKSAGALTLQLLIFVKVFAPALPENLRPIWPTKTSLGMREVPSFWMKTDILNGIWRNPRGTSLLLVFAPHGTLPAI